MIAAGPMNDLYAFLSYLEQNNAFINFVVETVWMIQHIQTCYVIARLGQNLHPYALFGSFDDLLLPER